MPHWVRSVPQAQTHTYINRRNNTRSMPSHCAMHNGVLQNSICAPLATTVEYTLCEGMKAGNNKIYGCEKVETKVTHCNSPARSRVEKRRQLSIRQLVGGRVCK